MNRQTDRQTERWKMNKKMEKLKDGKIQLDGKTERQKDKLTVRWQDRQEDS